MEIVRGDIAQRPVDAIVNAANTSLLGGGGVDGAIHQAAGPELFAACKTLGGCAPGGAKITAGYRLPARFVIHTVGPVWSGGERDEAEVLASVLPKFPGAYHRARSEDGCLSCDQLRGLWLSHRGSGQVAVEVTAHFLRANAAIDRVEFVVTSDSIHATSHGAARTLAMISRRELPIFDSSARWFRPCASNRA